MFQIGVNKFLRLKTSKTLYRGNMLLVILKTKKEFKVKKTIHRKGDKLYIK